ncbi:hypothetical protein R1sor_005961 [Riccia sorocarpa]|uniref:BTB domain-containing protein n=1 Tax=Riccia sorocarpa TaxID=122646 RepID=A0ABD3HL18_9MARC
MARPGGPMNSGPLVRLGQLLPSSESSRRVKLNVGGRVFETYLETLTGAGKGSHLVKTVSSAPENSEVFFDRDPETFAILLNLLRNGAIDEVYDSSTINRLVKEARFYGLLDLLQEVLRPNSLDGIDVEKIKPIIPNGVDFPSALAPGSDSSLWVGHGSKVTVYDWAQRKGQTTVTELSTIKSLHRISPTHAAVGADDFPGLHIYDFMRGVHSKSLTWVDNTDPRVYSPVVRAVTSSETQIFASFESGQKLDNVILIIDKERYDIQTELARQNGNTGHSKAATSLQWLPEKNLLLVGASHGGAFGYSGYIRLWDIRTDKQVWDWEEPNYKNPRVEQRDVFADMVASEEISGIFKVSISSGAIAMADLRHLDATDPWLTLAETNPDLEAVEGGEDIKLLTYNKQLYVSRGASLEVWSEVPLADSFKDLNEKEYWETSFRRNYVDHRRHMADPIIQLAAGGDRLFAARKEQQAVEIWETRPSKPRCKGKEKLDAGSVFIQVTSPSAEA